MDSPHLDYAQRSPKGAPAVVALVLPFAALAASIAIAVFSFSRMDGERLAWEGGYQYFRQRFPMALVLGLAAAGALGGVVCAAVFPRRRRIAIWAIVLNILWTMWWVRHLFR